MQSSLIERGRISQWTSSMVEVILRDGTTFDANKLRIKCRMIMLIYFSTLLVCACYYSLVVRVHWVNETIYIYFLYNSHQMNLLHHVGSTSAIEATGMPSALNDTVLISSGITGGSQYPSNSVKKSSKRDVYDSFVGTTCFGVTSVK